MDSLRVVELGEEFDVRDFRSALGTFATGVTVITTCTPGGELVGLTANSFSSVSLHPPLVLWSQSLYAPSLPVFQTATGFAVNILAEDQIEISQRFARPATDKFAGVDIFPGVNGAPLIRGAAAYFECRNEARHYGGDHVIFLGRVERYAYSGAPTLLFLRGKYMRAEPVGPGPATAGR